MPDDNIERREVTEADVENAVGGLRARGLLGDTDKNEDGTRSAAAWKACIYEDTGIVRLCLDEIEKYGDSDEIDVTQRIAVALKETRRLESDLYRYADEVHGIDRQALDAVRL